MLCDVQNAVQLIHQEGSINTEALIRARDVESMIGHPKELGHMQEMVLVRKGAARKFQDMPIVWHIDHLSEASPMEANKYVCVLHENDLLRQRHLRHVHHYQVNLRHAFKSQYD